MQAKRIVPILVLFLPVLIAAAALDDDIPQNIPDKAATRKEIDDLIGKFKTAKTPATLGMLQECMDLSVSYGAPAWNQKDHEECCNFYTQTAASLVAAFGEEKSTTPEAAAIIVDLKAALTRVAASKDVEQNAWSLRYIFDKTLIAFEVASSHGESLVSLGSDYLARNSTQEAQDAFSAAEKMLAETQGRDPRKVSPSWRVAPIALAHALLVQKKYAEAAAAITRGIALVPEWPQSKMDLRAVYGNPATVDVLISDLKAEVRRNPQDPGLQFLLGYEYYFTGDKDSARTYFEKAQQLDPKNAPARAFLKPPPMRV